MGNPANAAAENSGKLSWLTRVAYGLGDTAQNNVGGATSILTSFYTAYAGIDPAMVGLAFQMGQVETLDSLDECAVCVIDCPHLYRTARFLSTPVCVSVRHLQLLHNHLLYGTQPAVRLAFGHDDAHFERA